MKHSSHRFRGMAMAGLALLALAMATAARWRQPNEEYAVRRARLRATLDAPAVLFGYTGHEQNTGISVDFEQEENFYYLTGWNEPGAAIVLVPEQATEKHYEGPKEILFLPSRDPARERWLGPRTGPGDPDVAAKTGFSAVEPFTSLKGDLEKLAKLYPNMDTLLPQANSDGYPHLQNWLGWLRQQLPQENFRDLTERIGAMRQVKSAGELALLEKAIDLSVDAQLDAMRMMRPGLAEYQLAARMEFVHFYGGCEAEGYPPIVGAGFNSTVLHYSENSAVIKDGDVVVLDVACSYGGYSADITRTLPADGHFTARQREIYDIVLGAQNAALAEVKPGMTFSRTGPNSLYRIAYDYIDTHGKDREGHSLGRYFIHGLGHHIGLDVHDAGDSYAPLVPGMVVTMEPGIYIPEESLGVRIEDDILISADGYKLLSARLPRSADEIEHLMATQHKDLKP